MGILMIMIGSFIASMYGINIITRAMKGLVVDGVHVVAFGVGMALTVSGLAIN